MREIINRLAQKPRALFLVDGIGAFITAFLLLVILRTFNEYVGMPPAVLTCLTYNIQLQKPYKLRYHLFFSRNNHYSCAGLP